MANDDENSGGASVGGGGGSSGGGGGGGSGSGSGSTSHYVTPVGMPKIPDGSKGFPLGYTCGRGRYVVVVMAARGGDEDGLNGRDWDTCSARMDVHGEDTLTLV